jgi:hypothetical protein
MVIKLILVLAFLPDSGELLNNKCIEMVLCSLSRIQQPDSRFEFQEDTKRDVSIMRGKSQFFGNWNSAGDFIRWPGSSEYSVGQKYSAMPPTAIRPANQPHGLSTENVYEYRSGMIVPGVLTQDGNFIPDLGGRVMALSDYLATDPRVSIYNLPGRIVKPKAKE